jgi:hypothetical protein
MKSDQKAEKKGAHDSYFKVHTASSYMIWRSVSLASHRYERPVLVKLKYVNITSDPYLS